jgi:hypothetical protein
VDQELQERTLRRLRRLRNGQIRIEYVPDHHLMAKGNSSRRRKLERLERME